MLRFPLLKTDPASKFFSGGAEEKTEPDSNFFEEKKTEPESNFINEEKKTENIEKSQKIPRFFFEISDQVSFLPEQEYIEMIESSIRSLQRLFSIPKQKCITTLKSCGYDICAALERLYKEDNASLKGDFFIEECKDECENREEKKCLICEEVKNKQKFTGIDCSHTFCNECYRSYIENSMDSQGFLFLDKTFCPFEGCKRKVGIDFVEEIFSLDQKIKPRIKNLMRLFILNTRPSNIQNCPAPACNYIYTLPENLALSPITIKCPNNHEFCHQCKLTPHFPFNCQEHRNWFLMNDGGDHRARRDYLWVWANCKKCPNCKWEIQKNEGCNHMTCRRCNHEFCWLCFQEYHAHNDASCKRIAAKNKLQKDVIVKTGANFLKKSILLKIAQNYATDKKRKEDQFFLSISKKEDKENRIAEFKLMNEIDDILFRASRVANVFFMDEKKEKEFKLLNDVVRMKRVKLQYSKPSAYVDSRNKFIEKELIPYLDVLEGKLEMSRKPLGDFASLMYD